jgi:hypothetical protein
MAASDEHDPLEVLASVDLQERYVANATKDEYCLPEDLWNYAADFVDHVERYQKALVTHPELATMSVEEMRRRSRDEAPPFTRRPGPFRDPELGVHPVLVARSVPAAAIPAVDELRRALYTHKNAIEEAPSWAALVRESEGWAAIREAARKCLAALNSAADRPAD